MVSDKKKFVTEERLDALARELVAAQMSDSMTLSQEDAIGAIRARTHNFINNCNASTDEEVAIATKKVCDVTNEIVGALSESFMQGYKAGNKAP